MLNSNASSRRAPHILFIILSQLIFLNLAWNHSYLGEPLIHVANYYRFLELPIFQYRALPSFVYCVVSFGCNIRDLKLNAPVNSTAAIFQIFWDFSAINLTFFAIRQLFFSNVHSISENRKHIIATFIVTWLIAFSYIFVPNRAFFYTYDFSDFAIMSVLAGLALRNNKKSDILACPIIFVGAFNKETVLIFAFIFFILRWPERGFLGALKVAIPLFILGFAGKLSAISFADYMILSPDRIEYVANQIMENLSQLKNLLFYFSFSGVTAFSYFGLILIRKNLDTIDRHLLFLSVLIFVFLFCVGITRELRIYAPITVIFLIIFSRHRDAVFKRIASL